MLISSGAFASVFLIFVKLIAPSTIPTNNIGRKSGTKATSPSTPTAPLDTRNSPSLGSVGAIKYKLASPAVNTISALDSSVTVCSLAGTPSTLTIPGSCKRPAVASINSLIGPELVDVNFFPKASKISMRTLSKVLPSAGAFAALKDNKILLPSGIFLLLRQTPVSLTADRLLPALCRLTPSMRRKNTPSFGKALASVMGMTFALFCKAF